MHCSARAPVLMPSASTPAQLYTKCGIRFAWTQASAIAEILISADADVNARDKDGRTPLDYVHSQLYGARAMEVLKKHGARSGREPLPHLSDNTKAQCAVQ